MKQTYKKAKIAYFIRELDVLRLNIRKFYLDHLQTFGRSFYILSGIVSFFILIFEYGFYYPTNWIPYVKFLVSSLVYYFLFYEILSFLFSHEDPKHYLKTHKIQVVIIVLILLESLFEENILNLLNQYHVTGSDSTLIFLSTNQILFTFANLAHFYRISKFSKAKKLNPSFIFISSFAFIIFLGSLFLHFPKASYQNVKSIDIIFTAVSATCVTGLSTINISEQFTLTGQLIILLMIQIGGLGLMTLSSFFSFILAGQSTVNDKLMIKDLLSEESIGRVKSLLTQIAFLTFWIELIGSILLFLQFPKETGLGTAEKIYYSVFHSISAFCNAGFSLMPSNFSDPNFSSNVSFLSSIMFLIVLGGLGFPVVNQLYMLISFRSNHHKKFSVTSKLVLISTLSLIGFGAVSYFYLEQEFTLKNKSLGEQILHSLFYSITTRTAGFNTLDIAQMGLPITFISFFLMWVGASPISTGGGVKTTTIAISFLNIVDQIRGKERLEIFHRSIAPSTIARASASIVLSLFVIFSAILSLLLCESAPFVDICFEVVSAFGTVGLTRGLTPVLSSSGKIILCFVMFVGRVGILTLLIAITRQTKNYAYKYPVEYVVVG
ncbi:cation transport protein [Leptospira ryugenii]|uniref:Cation transport protein n=1 Tax=Leptospira ryugenii TaxID=1917863 RepID=A0A2P2E2R8_9LEPT|nr:potassium transporter TrkG [Leptospira ryugenii]GBF51192.1 cation transport protein [Leptospira ryugenii]